jgi:DNA-binding MarR family transcriptional regulator
VTDLRRLFDDLVRFETLLWATVDETLQRDTGLTLGTVNVMLVIDSTPNCRVLDIAEALAITVGGASQAVDRLAKADGCARRPHPHDRRSSVVELTSSGLADLRRAEPVFDAELERLFALPLTESAATGLAESLSLLRRAATRS